MMKIQNAKSYIEEGKTYMDDRGGKWMNPRRDSGIDGEPWRLTNPYGHIRLFSDDGRSGDRALLFEIADAFDEGAR